MKNIMFIVAVLAISIGSVSGQLTSSSLRGTVSTPDGVLPGATVLVKNNGSAKAVTVQTDGSGNFVIPNLEVGSYTVTITAAGFKTVTVNELIIETNRVQSLPITLEIGAISEIVNVTGGTEIINSADGKITNTVTRKTLEDLPSLGRNPLNFVPLQAGAASNPSQNTVINGIRTSGTNITIDGINVQDNFIRSNATDFSPARPSVDEVEEFAISSQANADDGFGGAQIQFTTRRGGNQFHGGIFEFNRNSKLAANPFFNNANGLPRPFRNRNQFGGNIGGPILKDKLFFFFSYEKIIDRQPAATQFSTTLTQNARQGIFTYTAAANDPANGIVAGQIVSVNLLNPAFGTGITSINPTIASRVLGNLPAGNSTATGDQRNTTGFAVVQSSNSDQRNYVGRVDYNLNSKHSFTGTYRNVEQSTLRPDIDNTFKVIPDVVQPSTNPFVSFGWTWAPSNRFTNEIKGGYFNSEPVFLRTDQIPANFLTLPLITNPEDTFLNQGRFVDTYNVQNNSTFLAGNHTFRFGGQFQRVKIDAFNDAGIRPTFTIGTNVNTPSISTAQFTNTALFPGQVPTAQRAAANSLLALLGGIVSAGTQTFNAESQTSGFVPGATNRRIFNYEAYSFNLSDQWRPVRNLTVNLGLRYDLYTALVSENALFLEPVISNPDDPFSAITDPLGRQQFVGGNVGKSGQFYETDKNNFSPVLSAAWSPSFTSGVFGKLFGDNKTVFRGGFRISYINDELVRAPDNALGGNSGLSLASPLINPITNTTALNARVNSLPNVPVPVFTGPRTFAQVNASQGLFGTVFAVDPKVQSPLVQEYSFGITREVGFDTAVEVRYVGTRSTNLLRGVDLNQVDIRNNGFAEDFNRARNNLLACNATAGCNTGGNYNAGISGSQQLTVFPNLGSGGLLTNATITGNLIGGTPADLAIVYVTNGLAGNVSFLRNPNAGPVDLLGNFGSFNYNSLQVDVRRRFTHGLALNANYTFSKNLTDAQGTGQTRFEPLLDNLDPDLERSRADFDQTHTFNVLASYDLPFGKGRTFLNTDGILDKIVGGWNFGSIISIGSGAPITITDARGTLNRAARAGRQTALTNLSTEQLNDLAGVYSTPNGIFFLPPEILGRNADGTINTAAGGTGRGANGFGSPAFAGQVFLNNLPGTTSGLQRAILTGPTRYNVDLTLIKRFAVTERINLQVQGDMFNAFNRTNFVPGQFLDVNGTNFGRITTAFAPRVSQLAFRVNF